MRIIALFPRCVIGTSWQGLNDVLPPHLLVSTLAGLCVMTQVLCSGSCALLIMAAEPAGILWLYVDPYATVMTN